MIKHFVKIYNKLILNKSKKIFNKQKSSLLNLILVSMILKYSVKIININNNNCKFIYLYKTLLNNNNKQSKLINKIKKKASYQLTLIKIFLNL